MHRLGSLPSTENLQCFLAAAEHLHFGRAASAMALTPTAFGQRIRQLEDQLRTPLFERTTRRVALTEAGLALGPRAKAAVAQAASCLAVSGESASATFSLGSRFEFAASWLAPALAAVATERPGWRVHLYCGSGPDILDRLFAGELDAVVTSAPVSRSGFVAAVLHPESYVFVGAPALLIRSPLETARDADQHTLLDVDRTLPLTRYLTSTPGDVLTFGDERYLGSGAAIHALVRAGHGVAVLPEYMVARDLEAGVLVRLLPERALLTDTFRLIYRRAAPLSRTLERLAAFLRTQPLT